MLLPLLKSDLHQVILDTMAGKLANSAPVWHQDNSAVTVVMASAGYPGSYKKGVNITGVWERRREKKGEPGERGLINPEYLGSFS